MPLARGVNRTVVLVGPWAIKVPSLRNGMRSFVYGMLSNTLEAEHWRMTKHPHLAPVYSCGSFGLWLVMRRYYHLVTRQLTEDERKTLPFIGIDDNGANIALDDGRLVLIDYGNPTFYLDVSA